MGICGETLVLVCVQHIFFCVLVDVVLRVYAYVYEMNEKQNGILTCKLLT